MKPKTDGSAPHDLPESQEPDKGRGAPQSPDSPPAAGSRDAEDDIALEKRKRGTQN
jgi:hypothetical protein